MSAPSILALDLAKNTGVAFWREGMQIPRTFVKSMRMTGEDVGRAVDDFSEWLSSYLSLEKPRYVVFEAPWVGEKTHQNVARKLMGLAILTELECYRLHRSGSHCTYLEVNNQDVRTHFLGEGARSQKFRLPGEEMRDALKRMTILRCEARDWNVDTDDEADALALLDYAAHHLKLPVPWDARPAPSLLTKTRRAA